MLIGYARVSTSDQDLSLQTHALNGAGCEKLFTDKMGGTMADRPGLADALSHARAGDCLVVWKLDRLGRTFRGLVELAADLAARGINFRSLTDGIDTSGAAGRLVFNILASIAEMERELVKERTMAALALRKGKGGGGGRKPLLTPKKTEQARKLLDAGEKPRDVAELVGVSVATLYRRFPAGAREAA